MKRDHFIVLLVLLFFMLFYNDSNKFGNENVVYLGCQNQRGNLSENQSQSEHNADNFPTEDNTPEETDSEDGALEDSDGFHVRDETLASNSQCPANYTQTLEFTDNSGSAIKHCVLREEFSNGQEFTYNSYLVNNSVYDAVDICNGGGVVSGAPFRAANDQFAVLCIEKKVVENEENLIINSLIAENNCPEGSTKTSEIELQDKKIAHCVARGSVSGDEEVNNSEEIFPKEIIKCTGSEEGNRSSSSLNIFFIGSGYSQDQILCKNDCNLSDFSKILENDIYRLLYSNNPTQGFGLFTIEPFKSNLDKVNIFMLTSPIDCDYKTEPYCFFYFKEQVEESCPFFKPNDHIYVIIGYDDPTSYSLGGGTPQYSASHRKLQHEFDDAVSTFIHEFGHSLGLHDFYPQAYQSWDPRIMQDTSSIPNCDSAPGCPKWCSGNPLPPFETPCSKYLNEVDCMANSPVYDCLWLEENDPYFKTRCVDNEIIEEHNIGTECLEGAGCYWGCYGAGYRSVYQNNFANRFSQRIDSSGKKHTYEPVSERFVKDILDCCYPQSCSQYDSNHCAEFSNTYPQYSECNRC